MLVEWRWKTHVGKRRRKWTRLLVEEHSSIKYAYNVFDICFSVVIEHCVKIKRRVWFQSILILVKTTCSLLMRIFWWETEALVFMRNNLFRKIISRNCLKGIGFVGYAGSNAVPNPGELTIRLCNFFSPVEFQSKVHLYWLILKQNICALKVVVKINGSKWNLIIMLAVKKVEFVSDRMSYIIPRGRWCNIIVLNVHATTEVLPFSPEPFVLSSAV
jgi:hypothetical protein